MTYSEFENGFFVLDKPEGMTSHDVVQAVRRHLKLSRIGHLGTLDPLATGVLPLALGRATRLIEFLRGGEKLYEGTLRLGFSTDTYDREGRPTSEAASPQVSQEQLNLLASEMSGDQKQVPPPFSAKKVRGVRAYRLAREGVPVSVAAQQIRIGRLEFKLRTPSEVDFSVRCSAGTYVRSIAHDLGMRLGCGAHLTRLRRLASGDFGEDQALALSEFIQLTPQDLGSRLIRMEQVLLASPFVQVDHPTEAGVASGRNFRSVPDKVMLQVASAGFFRVLSSGGRLIALAKLLEVDDSASSEEADERCFHPFLVLAAKDVRPG